MKTLFVVVGLLLCSEISCVTWNQPGTPDDGAVVYACMGSDVSFFWNYTLEDTEDYSSIQWYFRSGDTVKPIAYLANDLLVVVPPYNGRFRHVTNGGIGLDDVSVQDTGNYTIEMNVRGGREAVYRRTVLLQVADGLLTRDGQLHASQQSDLVVDATTQEWSVVLSCGYFIYFGRPAFPMEWVSPSGQVLPYTNYQRGSFDLHLNSKSVEDGAYTCRVPKQHLAAACLHSNRTDEGQAKVIVDKVEVKIALMEVELTSLKRRVEDTASTPLIAFNVQAMEGQQLTSPSRVQFHTVLYNQGEGFDNETGVFTAPLTGSYFFLFHTRSQGDHLADSALMAHNVPVCVTYIYAGFQQGSCHAVVHLQKDGQVWVEPYKYKGYYAADTTSFSGFLLKSYA